MKKVAKPGVSTRSSERKGRGGKTVLSQKPKRNSTSKPGSPATPETKARAASSASLSPSSPIASASPKARRIRVKPNAPLSNTRRKSSPEKPKDSKKTLFSPAYTLDDEEASAAATTTNTRQSSKRVAASKNTAAVSSPAPKPQPAPEPEEQYSFEEDEFDPFLFIKNLPPLTKEMKERPSPLPAKDANAPRISLALDLDETLVHCSVEPLDNADITFTVTFNGMDYEVYVRKRPYLMEFLKQVSEWFEIIVFTASQQVYADKLLDILDKETGYIKHRVFRDSCVCVDGNYLKDLHILGRDLNLTAIVDNSVQAFGFQINNGIPIESWFDDPEDRELESLLVFLQKLKNAKSDVKPLIKKTFRLEDFVSSL